jgi:hypothetical protein
MSKFIVKLSLLTLLAMAVAGTPVALRAQATNNTPQRKISPKRIYPFHGRLKAIDNSAKTISLANETIQINSETMITKSAKPATLEDGVVGDEVSGSYRKDADGKLNAVSLRFAPKPPAEPNPTTNAPASKP